MSADEGSPLVSFLIVTHNFRAYLPACVASALGQTYPRIEVVLVDNASTDGSIENLLRTAPGGEAVRVIRSEKNLGPAAGANLGLPHCRGEFIARLDADDIALPDRIRRQMEYLAAHPDKDMVGGDVLKIDLESRALSPRLGLRTEFLRKYGSKWEVAANHTTLLIRRSALRERFYNPTLFASEDYELIEWFAAKGRLGLVPEMVGLYRQHANSITQRHALLQQLTAGEMHWRVRQAGRNPAARGQLAREDFSHFASDPRLTSSTSRQEARALLGRCLSKKDWLAAAYFASTAGRWARFFSLLPRAMLAGEWREVVALALMRTGWPVWKRVQNGVFRTFISLSAIFPGKADSTRLALGFDFVRFATRHLGFGVMLALICWQGVKPSSQLLLGNELPARWRHQLGQLDFVWNTLGFGLLAAGLHFTRFGTSRPRLARLAQGSAALGALVVAIEVIQYFLPGRHSDWHDIVAGWGGIVIFSLPWMRLGTSRVVALGSTR